MLKLYIPYIGSLTSRPTIYLYGCMTVIIRGLTKGIILPPVTLAKHATDAAQRKILNLTEGETLVLLYGGVNFEES